MHLFVKKGEALRGTETALNFPMIVNSNNEALRLDFDDKINVSIIKKDGTKRDLDIYTSDSINNSFSKK